MVQIDIDMNPGNGDFEIMLRAATALNRYGKSEASGIISFSVSPAVSCIIDAMLNVDDSVNAYLYVKHIDHYKMQPGQVVFCTI